MGHRTESPLCCSGCQHLRSCKPCFSSSDVTYEGWWERQCVQLLLWTWIPRATITTEPRDSVCPNYETVEEYNSLPGEEVLLEERFTEPHIVQKHREQSEREKEVRSRGETSFGTRASQTYRSTSIEQLFCPFDRGRAPKAVILQGHSGHGKSFAAQKIMYDWACGRLYREHFDLVFHLRCKELNLLTGEMSMVELLSRSYRFTPMITQVLHHHPHRVLFLIDGFDELSLSLDGAHTLPRSDLLSPAPLEDNISALLMGRILSESSLLVTTRSTASDRLSKLLKRPQRFAEILGFSERGVREYFQRFFKEEALSKKAYECVRTNETLFTACFSPVICWIICTVFREQFEEGVFMTKGLDTNTSIFVYFVYTLLEHHCQSMGQPGITVRLLRSLGELAERGMLKQQVLFDEKSMSVAVSDPVTGPFLCKFLLKKKTILQTMFSFMHLSFQEFFTALHYTVTQEEETHRKLDLILDSIHQGVIVNQSLLTEPYSYNRHLLPVLQFLLGLANRNIESPPLDMYPLRVSPGIQHKLKEWILRIIQDMVVSKQGSPSGKNPWEDDLKLFILHCLHELNEDSFVARALELWESVEFTGVLLKRADCWVLRYCLLCSPRVRALHLTDCNITPETLRMLQPALTRAEELRLQVVQLSDSDVDDLVLSLGEEKHLTKLSVVESHLSEESVQQVLSALTRQKSVGAVSLSVKTITSRTAETLLHFVQNTQITELSVEMPELTSDDKENICSFLSFGKVDSSFKLTAAHHPSSAHPSNPQAALSNPQEEAALSSPQEEAALSNPQAAASLSSMSLTLPLSSQLQPTDCTAFLHALHSVRERDQRHPSGADSEEHLSPLVSCVGSLAGLKKVELVVGCLTVSWANRILSLMQGCPSLEELRLITGQRIGQNLPGDGLLHEEGLQLLQFSQKSPDCALILVGRMQSSPSDCCTSGQQWEQSCNRPVIIQIKGQTRLEKSRTPIHQPSTS
ncbi:NACHT, LRR and PYD domains-containing protein 1 homolog isoform X2 [Sardina pilchardus]|uniref:NACHT, LRR and PYD domains-containing protein 1 homolog isoform X2 n=1 Tax=Sardina pilchardus TaxID=27697 RepID=UPI002E0E18E1